MAGRLQKPVGTVLVVECEVCILKAREDIIRSMNENLKSAVLAVLPLLPPRFSARDTRTDVSVRVFEDKFLTEEVQIKRMVVKFIGSFANDTRSFDSDVPVYRLAEAYL